MQKKSFIILTCCAYIALMSGITACNSNAKDELAHHDHNHEHSEHEHAETKDGLTEIVVEPEVAKRFGVEAVKLQPTTFNSIYKVSGKIMQSTDGASVASAPTAGIVTFAPGITEGSQVSAGTLIATVKSTGISGGDPNAVAKAAVESAKKEVERLKPLHEKGIVSTEEYNAAVATYNSAKAAYSPAASSGRIVAATSGVITNLLIQQGQYVEAGAPVASVSTSKTLVLRADLPQRYIAYLPNITCAKIRTPYTNEVIDMGDVSGKRITATDNVARQGGYLPIYFSFKNNGSLVAGTSVEVFLEGEPRENVLVIPLSAVCEQQGKYFVFVKLDEEGYLKYPVELGENDGENVEIVSGVKAGDNVVVKGAVTVRLAESSGVAPEGHSHNH
jgi:RND family efflux transporter MFP subunit